MNEKQTLYIVDDEQAVRRALTLLAKTEGLPSQAFDSGAAFLDKLDKVGPGCLLLDVYMPDMSGLELQHKLKALDCLLPVIILTGHGDIPTAVRAMQAGAYDFIEKPFDSEDLMERVRKCLDTESHERENSQLCKEAANHIARLTRRESQIMELLVAGRRNKEIAQELFISFRTVELHRANIMEKLEAKSLSDVVRMALLSTIK
jgi:two-component system, LuxR family, response regulator FixJ